MVRNARSNNGNARIDGATRQRWIVAGLKAHIIEQRRFGESAFDYVGGVMNAFPPADKVQQAMRVTVKRDFSDATNTFAIQKTIHPLDFAIAFLLNDTEWAVSRIAIKLPDDAELHGRDASSNPWN
jgi:hypothetical protein